MNYTFNKTLIEQVKAGTHCIEFNREKDSFEMLQALSNEIWPDYTALQGTYPYYYMGTLGVYRPSKQPDNRIPIPLSNFVQPEQSERDVMAELDERLKRLEDILLRDNEPCKAESKHNTTEEFEYCMNYSSGGAQECPTQCESCKSMELADKKEQQPEPKWTPKVGEWFKVNKELYYCIEVKDGWIKGDAQNTEETQIILSDTTIIELTKPTDKEVEDYMVGLAKEKGFVKGAKYKYSSNPNIEVMTIVSDKFEYIDYHGQDIQTLQDGDDCIWDSKDGWAEIVNPVRWRAEKGEKYWLVLTNMQAFMENELFLPSDNDHYNLGNYFQTKEQAEEMAVLMQFTLNNPELVKQLIDKKE